MTKQILTLLISSLIFLGCSKGKIYAHYEAVPIHGWHQDSTLLFTFPVKDTLSTYCMTIHVRHMQNYPYQNMWLFIEQDTIEFYLADERGNWLGNSQNGTVNMPVLYEDSFHFAHSGEHTISIKHGMRDSVLNGITDIGLTITKNGQK